MRYIGGKSLLTEKLSDVLKENTVNVKSIFDIFAGSGIVSSYFKNQGYKITSNDFLYFSYVLNRGSICLNKKPDFKNLEINNPIDYLNNLTIKDTSYSLSDCFIYSNYSPNENCDRMYLQNKNAIKIDIIRMTIEDWKNNYKINEDEYYYLLAVLINSVPYVSNISGVYGAYLKKWDKRAFNDLILKPLEIIDSQYKNEAYNLDSNTIAPNIKADLTYIDPPYNERQYFPNYHILETIAKYDNPKIKGITGMRDYSDKKSLYCKKSEVANVFTELLHKLDSKYLMISYNNEGLLSTKELTNIIQEAGIKSSFRLYEYDYRRYKSRIPNNHEGLKEQIYFIRKR